MKDMSVKELAGVAAMGLVLLAMIAAGITALAGAAETAMAIISTILLAGMVLLAVIATTAWARCVWWLWLRRSEWMP